MEGVMSKNRKRKIKLKKRRKVGTWTLIELIGAGGNGVVWKVKDTSENYFAMKVMRKIDEITYQRFKNEIHILTNTSFSGVIDVIDSNVPETLEDGTPWFVMPLAEPLNKYKHKKEQLNLISDFVSLARTLQEMHSQKISHRDIKPENILYKQGKLLLCDFGLVKYPARAPITPKRRDVGAKFTMAPEMRRNAETADGLCADVFSFAKTIWIIMSGESTGFDGQYIPDGILGLKNYHKELYLRSLDQLLARATDNDPSVRPTIREFADELESWLKLNKDFQQRNLAEWFELQKTLFPLGAPKNSYWENVDSIITILNEISKSNSLNHMFYPNKGGNTITGASRATEEGFIALHIGDHHAELVAPKKLTYESFGVDPSWDYFRLEVEPSKPSDIEGAVMDDGISEFLTEIEPGEYIDYNHWVHNDYYGKSLPDAARPVQRFLNGSFVFFCTASIYNQIRGEFDAYTALHTKMSEDDFRKMIQKGADAAPNAEDII